MEEQEKLTLSGLQHFAFCRRQWALIFIEQQWQENTRTAEGSVMHQRAHDETQLERRGDRAARLPSHEGSGLEFLYGELAIMYEGRLPD